jgi:hypothetical protein
MTLHSTRARGQAFVLTRQWDGRRPEHDEAKAARRKQREEKREAWRFARENANSEMLECREAVISVAINSPVDLDDSSPLEKLRAIMLDSTQLLYRRLDAAELVLAYELAPGALVDVPPSDVAAISFRFLRGVAEATETPERLRFRALKSMLAIQHKRAAAASTTGQVEKQKLRRRLGEAAPEMSVDAQWPPSDIAARLDGLRRKRR